MEGYKLEKWEERTMRLTAAGENILFRLSVTWFHSETELPSAGAVRASEFIKKALMSEWLSQKLLQLWVLRLIFLTLASG